MCGFAGFIYYDNHTVDPEVIRSMTHIQRHRGPDDQAFCTFDFPNKSVQLFASGNPALSPSASPSTTSFRGALGFNRLSVLDTSQRGRQPMSSRDGSVYILMNGEIYNSPELREVLLHEGIRFQSRTDTEVVLQWYFKYGWDNLLSKLNGMFALCILDMNHKRCLLARDPIGVKPLYLATLPQGLLFASEAKSFLKHPQFRFDIDTESLDEFVMFRYVADHRTLMRGVRLLPPGHWLDAARPDMEPRSYWTLPTGSASDDRISTATTLEQELQKSVQMQMLSDVKLGCQLSGGIDSSLISILAAESADQELDAISVTLDDPNYSEEFWIDQAARQAGVQVHKFGLSSEWFANNFLRAAWHLDQPINHPNTLGILLLAQRAKPKVTVLLSGEGADEVFGGYPRFFYQMLLRKHRFVIRVMSKLPFLGIWIHRKFRLGETREDDRLILSTSRMDPAMANRVYPSFKLDRALERRRWILQRTPGGSFLKRYLNYEIETYLQEMLVRQDKMTMAVGVENRVPFLDHRLVELVRNIPDQELVSSRWRWGRNAVEKNTKIALKDMAARFFGRKFSYRKKSGFGLPLREFLSAEAFAPIAQELLCAVSKRGLFDGAFIRELWNRRESASEQEIETLFIMFSFEAWASQFEAEACGSR